MLGPIPNSLGAGALNRSFIPHGLVTYSRGLLSAVPQCLRIVGEIFTRLVLSGEVNQNQAIAGEVTTQAAISGEVHVNDQLSGEIVTVKTILGQVPGCN